MQPGLCGICGYPDQALKEARRSLALPKAVSPLSLAYALELLPGAMCSAGRGSSPKSGQRR